MVDVANTSLFLCSECPPSKAHYACYQTAILALNASETRVSAAMHLQSIASSFTYLPNPCLTVHFPPADVAADLFGHSCTQSRLTQEYVFAYSMVLLISCKVFNDTFL